MGTTTLRTKNRRRMGTTTLRTKNRFAGDLKHNGKGSHRRSRAKALLFLPRFPV